MDFLVIVLIIVVLGTAATAWKYLRYINNKK